MDATAIIDHLDAAGLRGRGGAGFPTGRKWRTVRDNCSTFERTSVVVNAAEGEPGTLKDRTIMRNNPYQVIEGALIGALAVGADQIIVGDEGGVRDRGRAACNVRSPRSSAAGWAPTASTIEIFQGPEEYLYGEETALLETIDGRYPFPRTSPPWRRGVREVVVADADLGTDSGSAAHVEMATPDHESAAPPALVENLETLANVGPDPRARRRVVPHRGHRTVARHDRVHGHRVDPHAPASARCMMGTPLREVIELIGGGARAGPAHRRGPARRLQSAAAGRPARHAAHLRRHGCGREWPRIGRIHRVRRSRRPRRRHRRRVTVPRGRVVRTVLAVQDQRLARSRTRSRT